MKHRGPDDDGVWTDGNVGLAHRRLSIIDLSPAGHQPMVSPSGRYVIVYNGEIYGFGAMRDALAEEGYPFRGHSDTEVLLAAIERWGLGKALDNVYGMFAFAVWDRDKRELTLARDRVGKKTRVEELVGEKVRREREAAKKAAEEEAAAAAAAEAAAAASETDTDPEPEAVEV